MKAIIMVCAEAGSVGEAVKAIKKQKIDLALVDMLLDHTTGVQVIKKIKAICPNIIALVFSMSDKSQYVKQAIEVGARGYITKDEISEEIVNAIRKILKGHIYISKRLLKNLSKEELSGLLAGRIQEGCDAAPHYEGMVIGPFPCHQRDSAPLQDAEDVGVIVFKRKGKGHKIEFVEGDLGFQ